VAFVPHKSKSAERGRVADRDSGARSALSGALPRAGYKVTEAKSGAEALRKLKLTSFALAFLDVRAAEPTSLNVAPKTRAARSRAKIIILMPENTSENVLGNLRDHAYGYLCRPFPPGEAVELADRALRKNAVPPIEVIPRARQWVELLLPCTREAAEQIQSFLIKLECDLPEEMRRNVGLALRELVLNAAEWGGKFNPQRKVRIAQMHTSRMLIYRVADPGPGFSFEGLTHASMGNTAESIANTADVRERMGIRPGGFGIAMARAIADELLYNEAQNEVILVKFTPMPVGVTAPRRPERFAIAVLAG
jgi:DNA-binding response OmpR family regulator